jgi:hypothetical protein
VWLIDTHPFAILHSYITTNRVCWFLKQEPRGDRVHDTPDLQLASIEEEVCAVPGTKDEQVELGV